MIDHPNDPTAQALLALAQKLACDIREDLDSVNRELWQLDKLELVQLCCVLCALVPIDQPVLPWWRVAKPDTPEVIEQRRRDLDEALRPVKTGCGTYPGYVQHVRKRTEVCDPCRQAKNEYAQDLYRRKKESTV